MPADLAFREAFGFGVMRHRKFAALSPQLIDAPASP
jgi:hypothetical protein